MNLTYTEEHGLVQGNFDTTPSKTGTLYRATETDNWFVRTNRLETKDRWRYVSMDQLPTRLKVEALLLGVQL